jgi:threonine dehydratase
MERMKIVVEPSGAVGVAAAIFGKLPAGLRRAGVIISGGNIDPAFLRTL